MVGSVFEWDENKAHHKARKHGVGFVAALAVFEDPRRIERVDDRRDYGEDRIQVVGTSAGRVLFVVSTRRGDVIRLICTDAH